VVKKYLLISLVIVFIFQIYPAQSDSQRRYIEDLIVTESSTITHSKSLEGKLNGIISRAESYLLCGDNQKAISDYETASFLIDNLEQFSEDKIYFSFRSSFGLMIAYVNENMEDRGWECYNLLKTTLDTLPCGDQTSKHDSFDSELLFSLSKGEDLDAIFVNRPIEGPDQIPLQDCLSLVNNTERLCKVLIGYVKSPGAQATLSLLIDSLTDSARRCCLGGGLWKACVGPLLQKWSKWDQRWQMLRIPPDPAND
jgi:hypothetical protein